MTGDDGERFTVIANHPGSDTIRRGAKCWVLFRNPGNGGDRLKVLTRNIRGNQIEIFVKGTDLVNPRPAWVPDHVLKRMVCDPLSKARASEICDWMKKRRPSQSTPAELHRPVEEHSDTD